MFTEKPESGKTVTKLGTSGDTKTVFTERPATYASKSPGPSASKMVPSIIGVVLPDLCPSGQLPIVAWAP